MKSDVARSRIQVGVVIPCYCVARKVKNVIEGIGAEVDRIYCIDDQCPEGSGKLIMTQCKDPRVSVIFNTENLGVGGATIAGFRKAMEDGMELIAKIDGDGQMDPGMLRMFLDPIAIGRADFSKGNRFYNLESLRTMPLIRLIGNSILSFMAKMSTGYWFIMDPTNGYLAIHRKVLEKLPLDKVSKRYFFESDLLFRLNTIGAVVEDIPMDSNYENHSSNLKISKILWLFLSKHLSNTAKRIFYSYCLRGFSIASIELVAAIGLLIFGAVYGSCEWWRSATTGVAVSSGTVMVAALPTILGTQLLISFLSYDIQNVPRIPLHKKIWQVRFDRGDGK